MNGGGAPQPQPQQMDKAPPALPGITTPTPTVQTTHTANLGDPTQALFAAVNSGDYAAAQDALSRGADLTAQNQFGETPLDLAIALNRTNISFLILETRNELAAQGGTTGPVGKPWTLSKTTAQPAPAHTRALAPHARPALKAAAAPASNAGQANQPAGFLGFDPHN
ncbi:ankyrin repeat domain-containing protein [Acidocella sp.]|uniref:ankyrin repeat domain-containing protein n=1 Tax=Acidocella sp. TaxID=50710 RepID=UPI00263373FC|nr:ankyrin repeat domain-containing protein [Acidocella sp.]